ncbi:hypothetical protein GCM10027577_36290 [Spirosoma fluminis]
METKAQTSPTEKRDFMSEAVRMVREMKNPLNVDEWAGFLKTDLASGR